jgi:hypothetical protein
MPVVPAFFDYDPARGLACAMLLSGSIWLAIVAAFVAS